LASPHFLTIEKKGYRQVPHRFPPLFTALIASLLLHLLPFVVALLAPTHRAPPPRPPLVATLRPPPPAPEAAPLPPPPPLTLPEQQKPVVAAPRPPPEKKPAPREMPQKVTKTWTQAASQHLNKLNASGLFYPQEAIARSIEGEVLVLIIIDGAGHVSAARVEESSGHKILDDAALRAVRSLRSLPADAPREALLPVRFRLR